MKSGSGDWDLPLGDAIFCLRGQDTKFVAEDGTLSVNCLRIDDSLQRCLEKICPEDPELRKLSPIGADKSTLEKESQRLSNQLAPSKLAFLKERRVTLGLIALSTASGASEEEIEAAIALAGEGEQ